MCRVVADALPPEDSHRIGEIPLKGVTIATGPSPRCQITSRPKWRRSVVWRNHGPVPGHCDPLSISTPIGKIKAVIRLRQEAGIWRGTAHGAGEEVPLHDLALDENRLTWKQSVTKPVRLNLAFDVLLAGDTMTGTSKAGRLPSAKVTGERR